MSELDFLIERKTIEDRAAKAKAAAQANPGDEAAQAEWRAAKEAHRADKAYWRSIRAFATAAPAPADAVAEPETLNVASKGEI